MAWRETIALGHPEKGVEGYRLSFSASSIPEVAESTSSVLIFRLFAPTLVITG